MFASESKKGGSNESNRLDALPAFPVAVDSAR
jgi:hypothetical protein